MDHRPNSELTEAERTARVQLKKLLKDQQRRYKLEIRLHKARQRGDLALIAPTQRALEAFDRGQTDPQRTAVDLRHRRDAKEQAAVDLVEQIYHELQKTWSAAPPSSTSTSGSTSADDNCTTPASRQSSATSKESSTDHSRDGDNPACSRPLSLLDPHHEIEDGAWNPRKTTIRKNNRKNANNPQYTPRHVKDRRLRESRRLLTNMTKGRQQLQEFRNPEALRGYARQKFTERASLVIRSCARLQRAQLLSEGDDDHRPTGVPPDVLRAMVERLGGVRSVASVGCGPGCDAVGVVAFLQQQQQQHHQHPRRHYALDRIVFCDWAMTDWRPGLLDPLRALLVERQRGLVRQVDLATCDVRASLWEQQPCTELHPRQQAQYRNGGADIDQTTLRTSSGPDLLPLLTAPTEEGSHSNGSAGGSSSTNNQRVRHGRQLSADLIVVSYLLSETRGRWKAFFDNLVDLAPAGTLFLFTDPTAWQLHLFRERYEFFDDSHKQRQRRRMEFCWLDSSMYRPELQVLEGRLSAAVLLGMVTSSSKRVNGVWSD